MATPRPLSEADSLAGWEPGWRQRDQLRRQPAQQEAQHQLHDLWCARAITTPEWQEAMAQDDLGAAYRRLTASTFDGRDVAAQERRGRWRKYVAGLAPDSPSAKWHDAVIGPTRRQRLHEQYAGVDEPPADWLG